MQYELKHSLTLAGVGLFSAQPGPNLSFSEMLEHVRTRPMDEFMRKFLYERMAEHRTRKVEKLLAGLDAEADPALASLLAESCRFHDRFAHLADRFQDRSLLERLAEHSPMIHLRSLLREDQPLHSAWARIFDDNIADHQALPRPEDAGLAAPVTPEDLDAVGGAVDIEALRAALKFPTPDEAESTPASEVALLAQARLKPLSVFAGGAMRHKACLAPHALLRNWMAQTRVDNGRRHDGLKGFQTSYGRGLTEDAARASLYMEIVERVSAFASVSGDKVRNLAGPSKMAFASQQELEAAGEHPLDLSSLRLEVPYRGQKLWWLPALAVSPEGPEPCMAPAQLGWLFLNLDEPALTSGVGSTGLASGLTMDQARRHAILECVERDAEAVTPFDPSRCFTLSSSDPRAAALLAMLEEGGVRPVLQDLTGDIGVPCYKAFVLGRRGDVNKGTAAGLSGPRAAMSALTEIPFPFPGPPTLEPPEGLPVRALEDLPDYSTGSAAGDVRLLEAVLAAKGSIPVYLDLTREDVGLPVVRAVLPGLEMRDDFDRFTRISPRLFANYLRMFS
ncbi:MAG: ribosomal protein methylthiotransferase accessory factor [Desulfovibrionales bacterium]|nr:ribosomal protein methylthiotransferase accessory factor [Desulfovibrionales bacterium]